MSSIYGNSIFINESIINNEMDNFNKICESIDLLSENGILLESVNFKEILSKLKKLWNKFKQWIREKLKILKDKIMSLTKKKGSKNNSDKLPDIRNTTFKLYRVGFVNNDCERLYNNIKTMFDDMLGSQFNNFTYIYRDYAKGDEGKYGYSGSKNFLEKEKELLESAKDAIDSTLELFSDIIYNEFGFKNAEDSEILPKLKKIIDKRDYYQIDNRVFKLYDSYVKNSNILIKVYDNNLKVLERKLDSPEFDQNLVKMIISNWTFRLNTFKDVSQKLFIVLNDIINKNNLNNNTYNKIEDYYDYYKNLG